MMVGEGAESFAREHGVPEVSMESMLVGRELENLKLIKEGKGDHLHGKDAFVPNGSQTNEEGTRTSTKKFPEVPSDTVGCIIRDNKGVICVALSTGGTPFKRPGRIGDTPLWGSGGYAYKGLAAASTGFGEDLIRVVMAKSAVDRMAFNKSTSAMQAADEQVKALKEACEGLGGVLVMGEGGAPGVAFNTPRMAFGWVQTLPDGSTGEIIVGVEPEDLVSAKTKLLSVA
jgi:beta-aspartyl-peptidase (threonine type)